MTTDDDLDLDPPPSNDSLIGMVAVAAVAFLLIAGTGALAINTAVNAQNAAKENRAEITRRVKADRTACDNENAARVQQRDALLAVDAIIAGAGLASADNQQIITLITEGWSERDCTAVVPPLK